MPDGSTSAPAYVQPDEFPSFDEVTGGRSADLWAWLAARRTYNASHGALLDGRPLWRVHDGLYDLGAFVSQHPGGAHWLELTRGSDITEAFEAHHPDIAAVRRILEKYRVGTADWPRESPLTFKEGEFYDVLRARIAKTVKEKGRWPKVWSKIIIDASVLGYLGLVFGAAKKKSYPMAALAGVLGGAIGVMAHNFLHQKDNWRMYYEELVAGSHETFRIHHALSHHLYPNSSLDVEYPMFEPTLVFFPQIPRRNPKTPILNFLRVQLFYIALGPMSAIFTLKALLTGQRKGRWQDYLTYLTWLGMIAMRYKETKSRKTSFLEGSGLYLLMRLVCSYYQISVGLYAGHHADYIYRQGDAFKHPRDFGLYQLETTADRGEHYSSSITGLPGILATFADHSLHHLFPTIDHAYLRYLYKDLAQTCKEFGVRFELTSYWDMIKGFYRSQYRTYLNTDPRRVGYKGTESAAYKGWVDPKMGGVEGWTDELAK